MNLTKTPFGKMPDGTQADLYALTNQNGFKAEITPYGCRIVRLWVKDKNGCLADVIWGYGSLEDYLLNRDFQGTAVGRYANRIGGAKIELDGVTYPLTPNEGDNQLHGGAGSGAGFSEKLWTVKETVDGDEPSITFSLLSLDGEGGYPGNMTAEITYTVTADDTLKIDYFAVTDKKTVVNMTNHGYFNLSGIESKSILPHVLQIDADSYTAVDEGLIPTGELVSVKGTPLDFTTPKPVGLEIDQLASGYDHNFVLNGSGYRQVAEVYDPESGRVMKTFTDLPGIQLYTSNFTDIKSGKAPMHPHGALCLETQLFPDTPNHPEFGSAELSPGQEYRTTTTYGFSVR